MSVFQTLATFCAPPMPLPNQLCHWPLWFLFLNCRHSPWMLHRPGPNVALLFSECVCGSHQCKCKIWNAETQSVKIFWKKNKKTSSLQLPHSLTTLFRLCWDVDKSGISDRESSALLAAWPAFWSRSFHTLWRCWDWCSSSSSHL